MARIFQKIKPIHSIYQKIKLRRVEQEGEDPDALYWGTDALYWGDDVMTWG